MLALARVNANDVVYDLGSGDGRIVIMAAKKYGARGVGVELDPKLVKISRQAALENGVADKVTFIEGDLFAQDISPATVVTMYLWPSVNKRLEMKLRRELRLGARIVSSAFGIGNWRPDETSHAPDGSTLLLWTVPRPPAREPDVDFVPTPEAVAYEMLQLAGTSARDVVYDLGSGDGRIPILAAQKYGARGVGIELDPRLVDMSLQVARDVQLADRVTFIEADLFDADISSATIVTLSLSASVNAKLESKLRRDLRQGRESCPISSRSARGLQTKSFVPATARISFCGQYPRAKRISFAAHPISAFPQASLTTFLARAGQSVCVTSRVAQRAARITFGGPVMTRTRPAVFALAILVSPAVAVAQTIGTRLADAVATGMKVSVVEDDGRRVEGRVLEHSQESLWLSLNGSSQEIPIDRIVRIDKPDSLKNGALVGLGIGLAVGTFGAVLSSSGNIEPEWMLAGIAYQTVAWTLLGTGIDAMFNNRRTLYTYERGGRLQARVSPVVGRGVRGAAVSVTW